MENKIPENKIGILGAGHLGLTLAEVFLDTFLSKENLFLSRSGNAQTIDNIQKLGLTSNLKSNEELCNEMDITFIVVRPQNFSQFQKMQVNRNTLFVSGMAGVSIDSIDAKFGSNVCRMMTSGPETMKSKKAMAAIYPYNIKVAEILKKARFETYFIEEEKDMHYFTVGVCLPAAIVLARMLQLTVDDDVIEFSNRCHLFNKIYKWAMAVIPVFESQSHIDDYIQKMSTSGGVTEAIINKLKGSNNLLSALKAGIEKSLRLSK